MAETAGPLAGVRVLVTRPAHQAEPLARLIEQDGGEAIRFPTLAIVPPRDPGRLADIVARLEHFDLAVFVSRNAVERAAEAIHARHSGLPPQLAIAAAGRTSAQALARAGVRAVLAPAERFDSEALLELPALRQVSGRRVVIFRGEGGRELLGETLAARGARVEYAECYRRIRPAADTGPLRARLQQGGIDLVTVTSGEGLQNLFDMLGEAGRPRLRRTPFVVVSQRQAELARTLGVTAEVRVARQASDAAVVEAIREWRAARA